MADNSNPMTDLGSPGPGWTQLAGGDWAPPTDKDIPYTVNAGGKPSITQPGGIGMPGHTSTVDPRAVQAQAAARYAASQAHAQAKSDTQRAKDAAGAAPRFAPKFTPVPKKGK